MCSSPKPKTGIKGKKAKNTSGLASLSPEARTRFTQKANEAQERRYKLQQEKAKERANRTPPTQVNKISTKNEHTLSYWLFSANIKEVIHTVFRGKMNIT